MATNTGQSDSVDYTCHAKNCNCQETVLWKNQITWLCQKHLGQKLFEGKPISRIISPHAPCVCGSGKKFLKCCAVNPLRLWFVDRIGTRVYFYDDHCKIEDCETCETGKNGIIIDSLGHALQLYEFANKNADKITFTNIKRNENT